MKKYITKKTVEGILIIMDQPCFLLHTDEKYEPPTHEDLKHVREAYGLTQIDVAKILGVSWTKKGSSTVAKWEAPRNKFDHRQIPYAAWHLLLVTLCIVEVEQYKREK